MDVLNQILGRNDLSRPDGRALHAYQATTAEVATLRRLLKVRVASELRHPGTAQGFVLWAAERIRTDYGGGVLSWEFVYQGLGLIPPDYGFTKWLIETGLTAWGRRVRAYGDTDRRAFLYSLLAEGGLPDAALSEEGRYRAALLGLLAEIEAEGPLAHLAAAPAARRRIIGLPQTLQGEDQAQLMAELALGLVALRSALPLDLPPEAALPWIEANKPGWRDHLPLRLSQRAIETIIRPAMTAARPRGGVAMTQRELRCDAGGVWHAAIRIIEGALLPSALLPEAQGRRLRLVAPNGAAFLAQPAHGGWSLIRSGGSALMSLALSEPLLLSAHADGQVLGEIVLDPGLPAPAQAPSLWRAADAAGPEPEILLPVSGRGRTRAARLWVLASGDTAPTAEPGLTLGQPQAGPQGRLWPVSGQGWLAIGGARLHLATGADSDAPMPQVVLLGRRLPAMTGPGGTPVHLGQPEFLGAEGDAPLRPLKCDRLIRRPQRGVLGGEAVEWVEDAAVLARLRILSLPADFRLNLSEAAVGRLHLLVEGLGAGWHLTLTADGAEAHAVVDVHGRATTELNAEGLPGVIGLRLFDPAAGKTLVLSGLWPARQPRLISPSGHSLRQDRELALAGLQGWRGYLPGRNGAVLLRLAGKGTQIGLPASGEVRLAALTPTIAQALSLAGADGRVNLRLADGTETPRLAVGRYDWSCVETGQRRDLGPGETTLCAVDLHDPDRIARTLASGAVDLAAWLGQDDRLWFIQGRNTERGVMRPFVWAAAAPPFSTRDARLARYAAAWANMLETPADPGWTRDWALISAVRAAGDAGALDQVQALTRIPAAAVALLLTVSRADRAAALALETETPLWWPLVSARAWSQGLRAARRRIAVQLVTAGLEQGDVAPVAAQAIARATGEIVALRPELAAHLGHALHAAGLSPEASDAQGNRTHLMPPVALAAVLLNQAAQEAARRFDGLPQSAGRLT
ncbi:MAG: hypothetical protein JJU40_01150, partial [Rhodobacteraceae bacterium]|nr:hypothetical protein [Paracoccaceae bacterium]